MTPDTVPDMTESRKKAFDFASEAAKQLITVSTGVIAFTAVLMKDFIETPEGWQQGLFGLALFGYFASISCGLLGIFAMADDLEEPKPSAPPSIRHGLIRLELLGQMLAFWIATLLVVLFGIAAVIEAGASPATGQATVPAGPNQESSAPPTSPTQSPTTEAGDATVVAVVTPNALLRATPAGTPVATPTA